MAGPGAALDEFRGLLGIKEQPAGTDHAPPVTSWFGVDAAWCAMTCSYVLTRVGIPLRTAAVAEIMRKAQAGEDGWSWHSDPMPGDCVCFDWRNGGIRTDHVGMVEAVRGDGTIVVLEGNHSDRCERVVRNRANVLGFARPPWDGKPHIDQDGGVRDLKEGDSGDDVRALQERLAAIGLDPGPIDGQFGVRTAEAVRSFQTTHNLEVDGVVGPRTRAVLFAQQAEHNPHTPLAVDGDFGPATKRALQWAVGVPQDGEVGPQTIKALQGHLGIGQDGVMGPDTVRALQARVGAAPDGEWGGQTTRALQHALNTGHF